MTAEQKTMAERHARDYQQIRLLGGPEKAQEAGVLVDAKYDPSLFSGRCRCPACKAAAQEGVRA